MASNSRCSTADQCKGSCCQWQGSPATCQHRKQRIAIGVSGERSGGVEGSKLLVMRQAGPAKRGGCVCWQLVVAAQPPCWLLVSDSGVETSAEAGGRVLLCRGSDWASASESAAALLLCCSPFQPTLCLPATVLGVSAPCACSLPLLWLAQCCHHVGRNLGGRRQCAAALGRSRRCQCGWRGQLQLTATACRVCVFIGAAHWHAASLLRRRHSISIISSQLARRAPQGRAARPALLAAAI